jgi:ADP-dependent NAD(P)H-hydrate dehydratase / NAD(P)H-hydrate epimerase
MNTQVDYIKVVTSQQMATIEGHAYEEGCEEETFMENAGEGVAQVAHEYCSANHLEKSLILLCGKGNNGGDAHVAGRYLMDNGYHVIAYQVGPLEKCSPLCQINYQHLEEKEAEMHLINSADDITFPKEGLIIDALFGTGLKSAPREPYASIIQKANDSELPILAVDIPSGLNGDSGTAEGAVILADATVFLGLPKKGFFLDKGWNHVGNLHYVDFGIPKKYIDHAVTDLLMFHENDFIELIPPIVRNQHKYQAGYVVGVAGSPGMPGAANLSTSASLRAGAGIVRLLHPKGMEEELSSSIYELIKTPYDEEDIDFIAEHLNKASAVFMGPGMGIRDETRNILQKVLPKISKPIVLDADALNVIAEMNLNYPKHTIITPHIGEMRRLLQTQDKNPVDSTFLKTCQQYVDTKKVTLILKGGPTFVLHPNKPAVVVPYGNPGMATAGSGDVLTGVVAAMLAHGLPTREAALCGVFAHAYAGDHAVEVKTAFSMIASDITESLPVVFKLLEE